MPSIYEKLRAKLGREPTNAELKADLARIGEEGLIARASKGKLSHQRGRGRRTARSSVDPHAAERARAVRAFEEGKRLGHFNGPARGERISQAEYLVAMGKTSEPRDLAYDYVRCPKCEREVRVGREREHQEQYHPELIKKTERLPIRIFEDEQGSSKNEKPYQCMLCKRRYKAFESARTCENRHYLVQPGHPDYIETGRPSSATSMKVVGLAPQGARCDCEHSTSFQHGHQAGSCRRPADVTVSAYGMKQNLCTKCAEAY